MNEATRVSTAFEHHSNSSWALPLLQWPLQWPIPFRLDQLHPGAPWQHLTPRSPCILLLPAPELLWCSSGEHPWEPTLNWYVYNLEVQGRPTFDLRGKGIMDKCHPFPWANSLGKHFIRLPAEGQLPMVVTYSIRQPRIAFPSFCISLAFVPHSYSLGSFPK